MRKEFEALVSHLYVVGGRMVSVPPPGALVQLAPRNVQRSRARDALFVLALPGPGEPAKAVFYEQMAQLAAERYFANAGGVTTGLREMLISLNDDLREHNRAHPEHPFTLDVICLVLREDDVYVAKTGGTLALNWGSAGFVTFPVNLTDPALAAGGALGMADEPTLTLTRWQAAEQDIIALGAAELAQVSRDELQAAALDGSVQSVSNHLKSSGDLTTATALIVQFILPDAPDPAVAAAPSTTAGVATEAKPVESVAKAVEAASAPAETPSDDQSQAPRRRFWQRSRQQAEPAPAEQAPAAVAPVEQPPTGQIPASSHVAVPQSEAEPPEENKPGVVARSRQLLQRGRAGQVAIAGAAEAAKPRIENIQTESRNVFWRIAQRFLLLLRRGVLRLVAGLQRVRGILDRILPEPEPGKSPSIPTPVAAGIAMLLPVAVVLLVVALALNTRDETAFERCLSQARVASGAAEFSQQNNPEEAQDDWFGVIEVANRCLPRRPDDPELLRIRAQAQAHLDDFAQVVRCPLVVLRRYEPGAELRGPILQNGVDIYTLDTTRSLLYRDVLNVAGDALIRDSEEVLRRGSVIGDYSVGDLVDVAWLTEAGGARDSILVALDEDGTLISYSPTFPPPTAQLLVGSERWQKAEAIDTWQGRLYVLDAVGDQVWRYQPTAGSFVNAPEEYFVGDQRPNLDGAVDIAIDQTGNVYILFEDGSVQKYYSGEEEFFQFSNLPNGAVGHLSNAHAMYLDMGFRQPGFYILDSIGHIIHETTLGGTFVQSYKAPTTSSFRDLSGLTVDTSAQKMYVTARDVLYHVEKCEP